ncbi:MAG: hypothetical protein IKQ97_09940 [Eubacterium sp.]|nr:hypothetical protein [Eubacterium sp.]
MKKKLLNLLLITALILTACGSAENTDISPEPETAEEKETGVLPTLTPEPTEKGDGSWAIYWYLCGSDLESDYGLATNDIDEVLHVKLPNNVKIVIQTGGASEWQNNIVSAKKIERYEIIDGDLELLEKKKQASMGDSDTLKDFLSFCLKNYPAEHKMVIFWDHGGGTTTGVAMDENFDRDTLSLPEMRKAFEEAISDGLTGEAYGTDAENPLFDIIGFDACLMATVDVASIFKDKAKYMIASEENMPSLGWNYKKWLGALAENTEISPADLGKVICDSYFSACEKEDLADKITLSVTDLSKLDPLLEAYSAFGDEALVRLMNDDYFAGGFSRAAKKTENYGGNTKKSGYSDMADMGDLAKHAKELLPNSYQAVLSAIEEAVIYQVKGDYKSHANGLSCFFNYSHDKDKLKDYIKGSGTEAFNYYYTYTLTDKLDEKGYDYVANLLGDEDFRERASFDIRNLEDAKVKIEDGNTAALNIGSENASRLESVSYNLLFAVDEGETFVSLGMASTSEDVIADWKNGIFKDNFHGVWGAIDGHPVYMELESADDDYAMYQVPVRLNGEDVCLSVACDQETHEFIILGAQGEYENGVPSRDLRKLKPGDKVTPILFLVNEYAGVTEFKSDSFIVSEDTSFDETELGDGLYAITFEMTGTDGKYATSEIEFFSVEDGVMAYL